MNGHKRIETTIRRRAKSAKYPTTAATNMPMTYAGRELPSTSGPVFSRYAWMFSTAAAARIVGIESRNENSAAARRERPAKRPTEIVFPEREKPWRIAETEWQTPTRNTE